MADPKVRAEDAPALPPESARPLAELAQAQLSLEQLSSFYPPGHQGRLPPLRRLQAALAALLGDEAKITIGFAEDAVVWQGQLRGGLPPPLAKLADAFLSLGVAAVTWREGVTAEELQGFASLLVERRAEGRRRQWEDTGAFPNIETTAVDYNALLQDQEAEPDAGAQRRDLWKSLLLRVLVDEGAALTPEEDQLVHDEWADPQELAAFVLEGLGEAGRTGAGEAVSPVQRLAALLERAAGDASEAARLRGLLADVARRLPPQLRMRLLEATLDGGRGLFAEAFGTVPREDVAGLLAGNFALEPDRIMRLTRVFQHLVPRGEGRGEEAGRLHELLRGAEGADGVPENAWQEVKGLLTGEGGDFMSPAYRETLERLAAREALRGGAEASFARLPALAADLAPGRTAGESLSIALESVVLATDGEHRAEALQDLGARARACLEGARLADGVRIVGSLLDLAATDGPGGEGVEEALRAAASAGAIGALLAAPAADAAAAAACAALAGRAPEAAAGPLVDAWARDEDPVRRVRLGEMIGRLGGAVAPVAVERLAGADGAPARALVGLLGELREPSAVPALVAAAGRGDDRLRREAAKALVRVDTAEARKALPALLADADEDVAGIAAAHLGAIGHQGARRDMIRVLERGGGAGLRSGETDRAVFVLGRMRAPEAVGPLAEVLGRRSLFNRKAQEALCAAAAQALRRIGTPEARAALEKAAAGAPANLAAAYRRLLAQWERP